MVMKNILLVFLLFFSTVSLSAKIALPAIFSDDMVLQQQTNAPIWGKATPGKKVEIMTSWNKKTYSTTADSEGNWKMQLSTPSAGGPYSITISDGQQTVLNNVMIGEVWLCSGQSNMEMPLAGWGKIWNYEQEIAAADYPNIRLLHADRNCSTQPLSDLKVSKGGWQVCSPATIAGFSSTAYFFGRNLHQNMNRVPIGLIHASWGGTIAEAWTSGESLEMMPDFKEAVQQISSNTNQQSEAEYQEKLKQWNEQFNAADNGLKNNIPAWADPHWNDDDWATMKLPGVWEQQKGLTNLDGIVWFRYRFDVPASMINKDLELTLSKIDDNDITYFNGTPIGATQGASLARKYTVPAHLVKNGQAVLSIRVTDTGGNGGVYGEDKNMTLRTQADSTNVISLANNWKYKISVDMSQLPPAPVSPNNPNRPTVLYHAMIHPIVPYAIKGAIWYQGESNAGRAYQYRELFPLMIQDWRKQWRSDFPFYFVQLANYMERQPDPQESDWAELREAQLRTLHLKNTGMAVTIDIGDANDIHPKNKQEVGNRLALAARAKTYGENIAYSGPVYKTYSIENSRIRISFDQTNNGLKTKDNQPLKGFSIAGPDHQFHWADAVIEGDQVVISSPAVSFPIAVRYAWGNNPECNLVNGAGLPASPFRTDDWVKGKPAKK